MASGLLHAPGELVCALFAVDCFWDYRWKDQWADPATWHVVFEAMRTLVKEGINHDKSFSKMWLADDSDSLPRNLFRIHVKGVFGVEHWWLLLSPKHSMYQMTYHPSFPAAKSLCKLWVMTTKNDICDLKIGMFLATMVFGPFSFFVSGQPTVVNWIFAASKRHQYVWVSVCLSYVLVCEFILHRFFEFCHHPPICSDSLIATAAAGSLLNDASNLGGV